MKGAIIILKIRDVFKSVENAQKMELFFDSNQQVDCSEVDNIYN